VTGMEVLIRADMAVTAVRVAVSARAALATSAADMAPDTVAVVVSDVFSMASRSAVTLMPAVIDIEVSRNWPTLIVACAPSPKMNGKT